MLRLCCVPAMIGTSAAMRVDELALGLRNWLARRGKSASMLVIEMHETPERDEQAFRQQLEWVTRYFTLVDLPTFARRCGRRVASREPRTWLSLRYYLLLMMAV